MFAFLVTDEVTSAHFEVVLEKLLCWSAFKSVGFNTRLETKAQSYIHSDVRESDFSK